MARPYDEFLGQSDPFAGSKPTTWNAGSQSAPFTGGNAMGAPMGANGRYAPAPPGYSSGPSFTPQQQQTMGQQQAHAERAFWAPQGGYGQGMNLGPQSSSMVRADIGGRTLYINRNDMDAGGNLKPEAFQRYGIQQGGGDSFAGGDPFSTGNLLNVGMQDANETQRKADEQYAKRDALNRDFAQQLQRNRDAMSAGIKDIEDSTRKSENWFLKGIMDYKDLSAEAMSSVARGIRMNAKQMLAEAGAYTRADGSMKTSQEIEQESRMVRDDIASQIQANLTPLAMQFNDAIFKANQDFSSFLTANAQLRAAQPLAAIQYDLAGRGYLNDYVAANPQTHVNKLDTLLAIAGIAEGRTAINSMVPGAGNMLQVADAQGVGQRGGPPRDNRGTPSPFMEVYDPNKKKGSPQPETYRIPFERPLESAYQNGGIPESAKQGAADRRKMVQSMLSAGMQTSWGMGKGMAYSPNAKSPSTPASGPTRASLPVKSNPSNKQNPWGRT